LKHLPLFRLACAFALASVAPAIPAWAQSAAFNPHEMIGKTVLDPTGKPVGQVSGEHDGLLFIKTDRLETSLPLTSFTYQQKKLYIAYTQAELNAEVEKTMALINGSFSVGAAVKASDGAMIGKIAQVDAQYVAITLADGQIIRIPRASVTGTAKGAVIGMTKAQLDAAIPHAQQPAPTSN